MAKETKAPPAQNPPADNNKRLAFLEDRLPSLIAATFAVIARFAPTMEVAPEDENEEPLDTSIRLLNTLSEVEGGDGDDATDGELAAIKRAEAAEGKVAALEAEIDKLRKAPPPAPTRKGRSAKARKVGPFAKDSEAEGAVVLVAELVQDPASQFEIVFSDGKTEIVELEPIEVRSAHFRRYGKGQKMTEPVLVKGSDGPRDIAGFGLFFDGEQVGWMGLPDPVRLDPGQERKFELVF